MHGNSTYSEELADQLCEQIAIGRSVNEICETEDWAPAQSTVYRWIWLYEEFSEKYARAKAAQQDAELEKLYEIADGAKAEDVAVARLRIDTRKWAMSKLAPKKYGDKLAIGGSKDMDPIQTEEVSARDLLMAKLDAKSGRSPSDTPEE